MKKVLRALIILILSIIGIIIIIDGIVSSDFSNLKKYDTDGGSSAFSAKEKVAKSFRHNTEVTIDSDNIANLGDFIINIAGNKKLITNISLEYKDKHISNWIDDSSAKEEILTKAAILRNAVILNFSGEHVSLQNDRMENILKKQINKNLSDAEVTEVYFNKFLIQ